MITLKENDIILFNGDSVTDALRDRTEKYSLAGYSKYIAEALSAHNNIKCFNRGCGGDTSAQLLARLKNELEEIRPTVFSFLIGVNDTWRRFDSAQTITPDEYARNVYDILKLARKYTDRIIVMEPFFLDVAQDKRAIKADIAPAFCEDLYLKIRKLREVARKECVEYIPLDGLLAKECCVISPDEFSYDGVHPSDSGHRFIAKEWLKCVSV